MLHRVFEGLLDIVSPPLCAACRTPLAARALGFCEACRPLLEPAARGSAESGELAAYLYGGPLRDALHRLKYEGASELAPQLAALLCEPARALAGRVDCVVPVPLHPRKLRARGYNQAALLARPVARALGVPLRSALLTRVRDTSAQVGRSKNERIEQLAEAFRARVVAHGKSVLVVDDVRTTGATLRAAREALVGAGARSVYTLALACTVPGAKEGDSGCL